MRPAVRQILLLVRKDLLRRRRAPLGLVVMLAFPLVFAGMLALAFGGGDGGLPRARLLLEDRDGGVAGGFIKAFLSADEVREFIELEEVDEGTGLARMEEGEASALLIVPAETTARIFDGEAVELELVRNPAETILPEVAEQTSAILTDVLSLLASTLTAEMRSLEESLGRVTSFEEVDDLDEEAFSRLALSMRRTVEVATRYVSEPPLELEIVQLGEQAEATQETDDESDSPTAAVFLLVLPGIAVYSLFVIGDQMMRDLLVERQAGTLRRQLTGPLTAGRVLLAKALLTALVATGALLILSAICGLLLPRPVNLPAFAALALALVLAITGMAAFLYGLVPDERRGATLSSMLYLVMAFAGGSFLPLQSMPAALRSIAPVSPFYWGTRGFQDLLQLGAGLGEMLPPILVLAGLGIVLLVAGTRLLERRVLAGGAL